jgi:hypothetical protein
VDYFVFHDLDLLPLDGTSYRYEQKPIHLSRLACNYHKALGCAPMPARGFAGVIMLTRAMVNAVNGWSNLFRGWGAEDDEMAARFERTFFGHMKTEVLPQNKFWHIDGVVRRKGKRKSFVNCYVTNA